jgi:hypothetical protein
MTSFELRHRRPKSPKHGRELTQAAHRNFVNPMTSPEPQPTWQKDPPADAAQRRETFARFGLAMYHAQCVERQIGILLAMTFYPNFLRTSPEERDRFFDREFSKTLGSLVATLRQRINVPDDFDRRLRRAVKLRNWLAHEYFWQRPGSILTWDGRERMIAELRETADFLNAMDQELTRISDNWLNRVGLPRNVIEAELEKYRSGRDG